MAKIGGYVFEILEGGDEESDTKISASKKVRRTSRYMSEYEVTALIFARALQLHSPKNLPMVSVPNMDPQEIATEEVRLGLVNLTIRRTLPDGYTEDWHPSDMFPPPSRKIFQW